MRRTVTQVGASILLLHITSCVGLPTGDQELASTADHVRIHLQQRVNPFPRRLGIEDPQTPLNPPEADAINGDVQRQINDILEHLSKKVTDVQRQKIRRRVLNDDKPYNALGATFSRPLRIMLEKVVPLKGREAMSPYYRAFAVKAGAVSIEEAEGAFVDHHVRRQNQKTLLRNTDEKRARRLHKQQQAYAQGEALSKALGATLWKHLREDFKRQQPGVTLGRSNLTKYALQYATRMGVINAQILHQRTVTLEARRAARRMINDDLLTANASLPAEDDKSIASSNVPSRRGRKAVTVKSEDKPQGIELTPTEGEGEGITIHINRPMSLMMKKYSEGFSMSKVFGDAVSAQVRTKRILSGLSADRRDVRNHLENLAVHLGMTTKEALQQRRNEQDARRYDGLAAGRERRRLAREQMEDEEDSSKRIKARNGKAVSRAKSVSSAGASTSRANVQPKLQKDVKHGQHQHQTSAVFSLPTSDVQPPSRKPTLVEDQTPFWRPLPPPPEYFHH